MHFSIPSFYYSSTIGWSKDYAERQMGIFMQEKIVGVLYLDRVVRNPCS